MSTDRGVIRGRRASSRRGWPLRQWKKSTDADSVLTALLAGVPHSSTRSKPETSTPCARWWPSASTSTPPRSDGTTALHWAAHFDNLAAADLLIRAGASVKAANRYGATPLWLACINGSEAMVEKLLGAGADPNTTMPEGDTALMTAARTGNVGAVKALLASWSDRQCTRELEGADGAHVGGGQQQRGDRRDID